MSSIGKAASLLYLMVSTASLILAGVVNRVPLALQRHDCEKFSPAHVDSNTFEELSWLLLFKQLPDSKIYRCQQNLNGKVIEENAEQISLSFNTTIKRPNQYFSARLKTDKGYGPSNSLLDFELTAFNPETKEGKLRVLYKTNNQLWRFVTFVPASLHNYDGNDYRLLWNTAQGTFSISVNGVNLFENKSIRDNFDLVVPSIDQANLCDRGISTDQSCLPSEGHIAEEETEQKVTEVRDWSKVHTPSKAFEQPSIKEKIERLKKMSPYLNNNEDVIDEEYIILRLKITNEIKRWQEANPETIVTKPTIIQKVSEKIKEATPAIADKLDKYALNAPAKYMEYETKNGYNENVLLYSMVVRWQSGEVSATQ